MVTIAGMFLTDLAYVYDGNPGYINNLINVDKMDQMVGVVREIQLSLQTPYCLEEVPHIQVSLSLFLSCFSGSLTYLNFFSPL